MTIDNIMSWFTVGPIQYASHVLVHSQLENILTAKISYPYNYEVVHYSLI